MIIDRKYENISTNQQPRIKIRRELKALYQLFSKATKQMYNKKEWISYANIGPAVAYAKFL